MEAGEAFAHRFKSAQTVGTALKKTINYMYKMECPKDYVEIDKHTTLSLPKT